MKYDFKGKKALVTGAGRSIGRAIAIALHQAGAHVFALSKTLENLESLKAELNEDGNRLTLIHYDLTDLTNLESVIKPHLPFDFLVNNAGIHIPNRLLDVTHESFDLVFNVNTKSPIFLSQIVGKSMVEHKIKGSIVNMSSQASKLMIDQHFAYTVSKAALDSTTKYAAFELGNYGIRVNCVNPTVVMTEMGIKNWSDPAKAGPMLKRIPLHKFGEIEDVVNAVMFLLSDDAALITGMCMPVDGGATM